MKALAAALALASVAALLWLAGEQHRENCIRLDRADCSVLPWESGEVRSGPPSAEGILRGR